jgi:hypothetical protein
LTPGTIVPIVVAVVVVVIGVLGYIVDRSA